MIRKLLIFLLYCVVLHICVCMCLRVRVCTFIINNDYIHIHTYNKQLYLLPVASMLSFVPLNKDRIFYYLSPFSIYIPNSVYLSVGTCVRVLQRVYVQSAVVSMWRLIDMYLDTHVHTRRGKN